MYFLKSSKSLLSLVSKFPSCTNTKQMFPLLFKQLILSLQNCKSSCLSVSKSDLTLGRGGYFCVCPNLTSGGAVLLCLSKSDLRWWVPHTNTNRCYLSELWTATDALTENPGFYTFSGGVLLHLSKSDLKWGVPCANTNRCYCFELWTATDALTENPGLLYLQWRGGTSTSVQIWSQVGGTMCQHK